MPRPSLILALMALAATIHIAVMWNRSADSRLVEMAARHVQEQANQNERLADLQRQWQSERTELFQQRDQLESDRKQLASERQRAPVIAESISLIGTLALALLPLSVCALLLHQSERSDRDATLSEILIADLSSPKLPPPDPTNRLPAHQENLAS